MLFREKIRATISMSHIKIPMTKVLVGTIEKGKIIPKGTLPSGVNNAQVKIFIFSESVNKTSYFGKGKGIFGDALKFQKKMRSDWK